eukprot:scaffold36435_cov39-Attheya_sp.AAC.1
MVCMDGAGRYVAISDRKCRETAPAPYHICSKTFTNYSRKFGGPCRCTFWPMTHVGWCGKIPENGRYKADNYSARRDRPVVKRSDDLAGTSFSRQVDSGPSLC